MFSSSILPSASQPHLFSSPPRHESWLPLPFHILFFLFSVIFPSSPSHYDTHAPILPLALGAASAAQVSGIVDLSFLPARDDSPAGAPPLPISLPVFAAYHVLVSAACLHASRHAVETDPASNIRYPSSYPVLGTDLANETRLHAFPHDAGADPASAACFPTLRDAAEASATRLPASRCDISTDPAIATRFPAFRPDADVDPASATRLPASRYNADVDQANATRLPASRSMLTRIRRTRPAPLPPVTMLTQIRGTRPGSSPLVTMRCKSGARVDQFPAFRHAADTDLASAARLRPAPRRSASVASAGMLRCSPASSFRTSSPSSTTLSRSDSCEVSAASSSPSSPTLRCPSWPENSPSKPRP
ncbi:unnamed protein product [Closterium sp. NIES-64]|nr:unnamed protein product [Closterium sp. NIES-64]